jgi:hypothetical protein
MLIDASEAECEVAHINRTFDCLSIKDLPDNGGQDGTFSVSSGATQPRQITLLSAASARHHVSARPGEDIKRRGPCRACAPT